MIAPLLNMVSAEQGAAIERYVEGGGAFLTTYFSGVVDEDDRAWLGGYPGPLRRTLGHLGGGVRSAAAGDGQSGGGPHRCAVRAPARTPATCGARWSTWRVPRRWPASATTSMPADPRSPSTGSGRGARCYVATRPERTLVGELLGYVLGDLGIAAPLQAPPSVEVLQRAGDGRTYTFVLNHAEAMATIELPGAMQDLIDGEVHTGSLELAGRGVAILVAVPAA